MIFTIHFGGFPSIFRNTPMVGWEMILSGPECRSEKILELPEEPVEDSDTLCIVDFSLIGCAPNEAGFEIFPEWEKILCPKKLTKIEENSHHPPKTYKKHVYS